jgi:hypothetical protein
LKRSIGALEEQEDLFSGVVLGWCSLGPGDGAAYDEHPVQASVEPI